MTGEFDDLFIGPRDGNQSWYDKLGPEARAWVDGLAQSCIERNQLPNFPVALQAFKKKFPKETHCTSTTLSGHVKRLVAELSSDDG